MILSAPLVRRCNCPATTCSARQYAVRARWAYQGPQGVPGQGAWLLYRVNTRLCPGYTSYIFRRAGRRLATGPLWLLSVIS